MHEGKNIVTQIGKTISENLNQANVNANFKIMADAKTETFLEDVIGNAVTEEITDEKSLKGIDTLGEKWNKEKKVIHGRQ